MPVARRASYSAAFNVSTGGTITLNKPTGTVDDDVMLAFFADDNPATRITAPAGWTALAGTGITGGAPPAAGAVEGGTDSMGQVYYRVASGEGASYNFTTSAGYTGPAGIVSYSGGNTATPIDVAAGQSNASSTSQPTASITPSVSGCMLVVFHECDLAAAASFTPAGTMGEVWDVQETSIFVVGMVADELYNSTDAVSRTATVSTADIGAAFIIAVAPAAAASVPTGWQYRDIAQHPLRRLVVAY